MVPYEGSTEGLTIRIRRNNLVVKADKVFLQLRVLAVEQPTVVSKTVPIGDESALPASLSRVGTILSIARRSRCG